MTYKEYKKQIDELNQEIVAHEKQQEQLQEELSILSKDKNSIEQEQNALKVEKENIKEKKETLNALFFWLTLFVSLFLGTIFCLSSPFLLVAKDVPKLAVLLVPLSLAGILSIEGISPSIKCLLKDLKSLQHVDVKKEDLINSKLYTLDEKYMQNLEQSQELKEEKEKTEQELSLLYKRKNTIDGISIKDLMKITYEKVESNVDTPEQQKEKPKVMTK